ncbi:hypothetical protein [Williamsia sp. 1135]|uniref:hypothetical protein n=1 Tax=Williamsia sp. 1135 TaxID=1889262 RepID=UPI001F0B6142|nr:hypothetical protein [Williamsia sp. 1135]
MSIRGGISRGLTACIGVLAVVAALCQGVGPAASAPAVTGSKQITDRLSIIYVYSPSMNRVIGNQVLRPAGNSAGAPTSTSSTAKGVGPKATVG